MTSDVHANRHPASALLLTLLALCWTATAMAGSTAQEFRFDVFFGDKRIGNHRFQITPVDDVLRVRSEADFEYRLMFVPVYRYRHEAEEVWQDGCLQQLTSSTDDNGRRFEVPAIPEAQASGCPASFAYWDLARLRRDSLINAQTGEPVNARLIREGEERIDGQNAERYRLELDGLDTIHLWYRAEDQRWLRLETRRDNGTLVYRLQSPESRSGGSIASAG